MQELKGKKYKEEEIIQQHLTDSESTHSSAVSDPVWAFLLKLHQRYATKTGQLQEDARHAFKKYLDDKYSPDEAKNKPLHDAYSHLTTVLDQPISHFDVVPENLVTKIKTEFTTQTTEKTATVMPLTTVFSLIYQATMDQDCYPTSSSAENRLLTLCNTLEILHRSKPKICHTGVRNDLAHTLNLIFKFPGSKNPVLFLDDIDTALLSWIKQKARDFLETFGKWSNTTYHKLMLQWLKTGETPGEFIKLFSASDPKKLETTIIHDYIARKLKVLGLNPAEYKIKINGFLDPEALKYLQIPVQPGELYYALHGVFNQPEKTGNSLRDQAFSQLKLDVEARLVSGQINVETEPQLIQEFQQFLIMDQAFVLCKKYRSVFINQLNFDISFIEQTCKTFYQKNQLVSQSNLESKREFKTQQTELSFKDIHSFITQAHRLLQDSHTVWIENFFTLYQDSNLETKQRLYATWFSLHELGKTTAPDDWLEAIYQKSEHSESGSIVRISPVDINRIVLHALRISPKKWTTLFERTYALALEQLDGEEFEGLLTRQFRDNAYPEELRTQLRFIKTLRDRHVAAGESKSTQAMENIPYPTGEEFFLPVTYWVGDNYFSLGSLFSMSHHLSPDQHASLIEEIGAQQLHLVINYFLDFRCVLYLMVPEQRGNFITMIGSEKLKKIIWNHVHFKEIFSLLNKDQAKNVLEMLSDDIYTLFDRYESLSSVLSSLNKDQHENFLRALGPVKLRAIIQNECQLFGILRHLNKQTRKSLFALMQGEPLQAIIENRTRLNTVLFPLKTELSPNSINLINLEQLWAIMPSKSNFESVLRHLNNTQRQNILTAIGTFKLNYAYYDMEDLSLILSCLNTEQYGNLLTTISSELHFVSRQCLHHLDMEQCELFFPVYKNDVLALLSEEYGFQLGRWRSHAARMDALKQGIHQLNSIKEIYDFLSKELEAYDSQAKNSKDPVLSPITGFSRYNQKDLFLNKQKSRYYQALQKAKNSFGFSERPNPPMASTLPLNTSTTARLETKKEADASPKTAINITASSSALPYQNFSASVRKEKKGDAEDNQSNPVSETISSNVSSASFFYSPEVYSTSSRSNTLSSSASITLKPD
jgi:hypothetical protein